MLFNLFLLFKQSVTGWRSRLIFLINLALLIWVGLVGFSSPTLAVLRQHHETPGVLRYHVQHSLQDKQGRAWQVVLFPVMVSATKTDYYLRLVGFPGLVSFPHPASLEIITSEGKLLTAADAWGKTAPAPNVGQFEVTEILSLIVTPGALKLSMPLQGDDTLALKIPKSITTEWQWLTKS